VLTDDSQLEAVRGLLAGGAKQVLSVREPALLLQEIASRLLGVTPRVATRVLVRLQVNLGQASSLVSCQSENLSETGMLLRTDNLFPWAPGSSSTSRCPRAEPHPGGRRGGPSHRRGR